MAQLPPKVPNMAPNWSGFPHQRIVSMENLPSNTAAAAAQNTSWVDEFLDFSMGKRGSHRRSISDSIAFIEPHMAEKCRPVSGAADDDFDRFDEEQLMSMFADDVVAPPTMSSSNTSTPSDHNSMNDEKQALIDQQQLMNDSEEVQSSCKAQGQVNTNTKAENSSDKVIDPKRVKRILANRQSAQRSRVRKLQYITELERGVNSLQAEVSVLSPRVAFLDHQRLILNVDNSALKQRIAALAQDRIFKDAHQEALRREIDRLRKLYHEQNLKKMENSQEAPSSNANG